MQLDKLQLDLHPRPNAQALDLGFALLRSKMADVYLAWLALWLPTVGICAALGSLNPVTGAWWMLLAWWLKPLLERAPLYVLSRQVFGESVTWREAVRAWPKQLGGGWFRMLTWWRPFMTGRGLYQPIWQLEGARGAVAANRRKVIGGNNTGSSAMWYGAVCAHFEAFLQLGVVAFIGIFLSKEDVINPLAYMFDVGSKPAPMITLVVGFTAYAIAGAIIGPIYTACCFTLYLNRRATLEAWDIEIMLRQIKPPAESQSNSTRVAALLLTPLIVSIALLQPSPSHATESKPEKLNCTVPERMLERTNRNVELRGPDHDEKQSVLRQEVTNLYGTEDLRGYLCKEIWVPKKQKKEEEKPKEKKSHDPLPYIAFIAVALKIILITIAVILVAWLLYRYRDQFSSFAFRSAPKAATEIGGLDIRPESLPDDVPTTVRKLWDQQQYRASLALLYRATLSRLVSDDGVVLTRGATEGDCLRLASNAQSEGKLSRQRFDLTFSITNLWLQGAYGKQWPDTNTVYTHCTQWQEQYGGSTSTLNTVQS
jgi:hypothetical protein